MWGPHSPPPGCRFTPKTASAFSSTPQDLTPTSAFWGALSHSMEVIPQHALSPFPVFSSSTAVVGQHIAHIQLICSRVLLTVSFPPSEQRLREAQILVSFVPCMSPAPRVAPAPSRDSYVWLRESEWIQGGGVFKRFKGRYREGAYLSVKG